MPDDTRCERCGWPLKERIEDGCTADNCSMRPLPPARSFDTPLEAALRRHAPYNTACADALAVILTQRQRIEALQEEAIEVKRANLVMRAALERIANRTDAEMAAARTLHYDMRGWAQESLGSALVAGRGVGDG